MARKLPTPANTRNGLKWRDGRPRWEPSPASRAAGLRGLDLKDLEGRWLTERGVAIAVCDDRQLWAQAIRELALDGPAGAEAAADLRTALEGLQQPQEAGERLRRALVADLLELAAQRLAGADASAGVQLARGVRTVERLVDAYFAAADAGKVAIKPATRRAYFSQSKAFLARFAGRGVGSIRRAELVSWYAELIEDGASLSLANLRLATVGALMTHAWNLEWIAASPAEKLGRKKAPGRLVFWTLPEERAFVAWCDAHGFVDVADAVTFGLWTGARPIDMCAADLEDLAGDVWHFQPEKTERHAQEAMPGLLPIVKARLDRRRLEARAAPVRPLNATPFLWDHRTGRRHTSDTLWRRFRDAKAAALAAEAVPETLAEKRLQDMRDTCITRLQEAGVAIARMWTWTGHSQKGIEQILRDHYLVLRAEGQREMTAQLEAWAEKEALSLS